MPVYLLHGFRWPRAGNTGIRVHSILQNLDDCSAEYIQNANSTAALLESFRRLFPHIMKELEGPGRGLTFLEQYDPEDLTSDSAVSQPFAFVGDKVVTIAGGPKAMAAAGLKRPDSATSHNLQSRVAGGQATALSAVAAANGSALSVNVEEVVAEGPGFTSQAWEAFAELRDKLAEKEKIGWWVVYNGDPERAFDEADEEDDDDEDEEDDGDETIKMVEETPANFPARKGPSVTTMPSNEKELPNPVLPKSEVLLNTTRDLPALPTAIPIRETTGKTSYGEMSTDTHKPAAQDPPKAKPMSKTEGFKKKFFRRRGSN